MRSSLVLVLALVTCTPAPSAVPAAVPPAATSTCLNDDGTITAGGSTVRGSLFHGSGPAVLVLHTRGGLNAHARAQAMRLAAAGLLVYAPDYFAPTGVTPLTFDRQTFTARHTDQVVAHLALATSCLRALSTSGKVAAVGFSMGGYIALALASAGHVDAAVSWYGAYAGAPVNQVPAQRSFKELAASIDVPVLLLHGDTDEDVRIDFARRAQDELERAGVDSELVIYPGVGHGYDQEGSPQYRYDARATSDSRARTLALLADALR
jgi:carboxymethylenebutenolidase